MPERIASGQILTEQSTNHHHMGGIIQHSTIQSWTRPSWARGKARSEVLEGQGLLSWLADH